MVVWHVGWFKDKRSLDSTDATKTVSGGKKMTKRLFYYFRKYEVREHRAKFFQICSKS